MKPRGQIGGTENGSEEPCAFNESVSDGVTRNRRDVAGGRFLPFIPADYFPRRRWGPGPIAAYSPENPGASAALVMTARPAAPEMRFEFSGVSVKIYDMETFSASNRALPS